MKALTNTIEHNNNELSFRKTIKLKFLAMKRILLSSNFVVFTFNNKFRTILTGHVEDNIETMDYVITAIKKADYMKGER